MAAIAGESSMLSFQRVPGLLVIKRPRIPLDQREVLAVVLRVAARALLARTGRDVISGVEALSIRHSGCDLAMTVKTFELRLASQLMASGAISRSIQGLVRPGKRARRDLRPCWRE